jgi:hypothetical protein
MTVDAPGDLVLETIASFLLLPADLPSAIALFSVNKHARSRYQNMHGFWRQICVEFGWTEQKKCDASLSWFQLFRHCWTQNISINVMLHDGTFSNSKRHNDRYSFFGLFAHRPHASYSEGGHRELSEETSLYMGMRQVYRVFLSHESNRGFDPQTCGAWSAFCCLSSMSFVATSESETKCALYRSSCARILEKWCAVVADANSSGTLVQAASLIDAPGESNVSFEDAVAMIATLPDSFCKRRLQDWAAVALFAQPTPIECMRCRGHMLVFQFDVGEGTSQRGDFSQTFRCQRCGIWSVEVHGPAANYYVD